MPILFEYGDWVRTTNVGDLKKILREVWAHRLFVTNESDEEIHLPEDASDSRFQPFLSFDDTHIRANNYVGFIQNSDELIEIFPKVFRDQPDVVHRKALMMRHIFYWLDYCRRWRFPFNQANLDSTDIESFPELIINLIAKQFLDTISSQPLTLYQDVEEALTTPRGSISFKRYIASGFATGNHHIIDCDHEPFLFDNRVNRIIKYCSRLLMSQTRFIENTTILQEIVFMLDDVGDMPCSVHDIDKVTLNPFFNDYLLLLDTCRMILAQRIYSSSHFEMSHWCLLFPMEYIFEDFIAGFMQTRFRDEWKVEYQKSDVYLSSEPRVFRMQHDIFLTSRKDPSRRVIVDTKYKKRNKNFKNEPKKGVDQADLYQMLAYALRRGCDEILLIYPNSSEELYESDRFIVRSGFADGLAVGITAAEIPFWSLTNYETLTPRLQRCLTDLLIKTA